MIVKELYFDDEGRKKLRSGIEKLAKAVKSTMGPYGRPVVMESESHVGGMTVTRDGVTVANNINLIDPVENIAVQMVKQAAQDTATQAGDGPQPLYAKVFTPNGPVNMGDIKIGDTIIGSNETHQKVIGVFPKGVKEVYEVKVSGGSTVECCSDHLWTVYTNYGVKKTLTTKEMVDIGVYKTNKKGERKFNFFIPFHEPKFNNTIKDDSLHPYTLGLLIGDGSLSGSGSIELSIGIKKEHVLNKMVLPEGINYVKRLDSNRNYFRVVFNGVSVSSNKSMKDYVSDLNLLGVRSKTKFIPKEYLYSSKANRMFLLDGLMDTDGYKNNKGLYEISTVSNRLFEDYSILMKSLGMQISTRLHDRSNDKDSYSNNSIFRITQLKGYKYGNKIESITPTGKFTEMQCIKVSNDDSLYMTDGLVLTHNTTTSIVLTEALLKAAEEYSLESNNMTAVSRYMQEIASVIDKNLVKMSKKVTGKTLESIARISANNDPVIGKLIADTYKQASYVTVENSADWKTYSDVADGVKVARGFSNRGFINDERKQECVLENAYVLISDHEITSIDHIKNILEPIIQRKASLLIIGQLNVQVMGTLILNARHQKLKVCNIIPPSMGIRKDDLMEDLAIALGGRFASTRSGDAVQAIEFKDLGFASKINISAEKTIFIPGPKQDKESVNKRIDELTQARNENKNQQEREFLSERIANISGSIGVIHVGANSDIEQKELKDRVDDAVLAVRAALEEGVLPGAGQTLVDVFKYVPQPGVKHDLDDADYATAYKIMEQATVEPFKQILENGGINSTEVGQNVFFQSEKDGYGYDAKNNVYGDLYKLGVIDPTKVTRSALKNAVSVATTLIMSDVIITNVRDYGSSK